MNFVVMGEIVGMRMQMIFAQQRIEELERKLVAAKGETLKAVLRATAADKLRQGAMLTREEVAAYLDYSERTIQRMERTGALPRCPNLPTAVRYTARDVLRLASANGKER